MVDDEPEAIEVLKAFLSQEGYEILSASNGKKALEVVKENHIDLILLDAIMPEMDGYEACSKLKDDEETRLIPIIMITALIGLEEKIRAIEAGTDDYINKPFYKEEVLARVKSLLRIKHLNEELEHSQNVIFSLALAIEAKDPYTKGHSERVAHLAAAQAQLMGFSLEEQEDIRKVGILHDIGKIGVDLSFLNKKGPLSEAEWELIKLHPVIGEKICSPLRFLKPILHIIRHHHERLDASGYPDRIKGDKIPLGTRIVSVADVYDALTSNRPYRKAMSPKEALTLLRKEAQKGFWDPEIVEYLVKAQNLF